MIVPVYQIDHLQNLVVGQLASQLLSRLHYPTVPYTMFYYLQLVVQRNPSC